jgi:hypothetical protein
MNTWRMEALIKHCLVRVHSILLNNVCKFVVRDGCVGWGLVHGYYMDI